MFLTVNKRLFSKGKEKCTCCSCTVVNKVDSGAESGCALLLGKGNVVTHLFGGFLCRCRHIIPVDHYSLLVVNAACLQGATSDTPTIRS